MENFIFLYSDEDININVINITHMQIRRCEKISSITYTCDDTCAKIYGIKEKSQL